MKRRGRGFADGADVNAGDEADVSGDVLRAKTRAASRDASPSDVPDWPKDGARVSDLARLGDDITPEKHAMTRASDDGPAPYSNTSPEVLEVLSPERSAIHSILRARARTTSPWTSRRPWGRTARASRRFWKMSRSRARRARARRRFSPGSRTRRARLMPRRSHCERLCTKSVSRRHSHCKDSKRRRRRWRSRRDSRRATTTRATRCGDGAASPKTKNTRWRPRSARGGDTRCGVRAVWSTAGPRTPRAQLEARDLSRRGSPRAAPTRATYFGGARVARRRRGDGSAARATREGRGRRGEEGARSRDKGRAGCARALACMDARSGFGQSRYRSRRRGRGRLLSRRWRFGSRFGSPGIEKGRARRRARRECHDGRCALPVRRDAAAVFARSRVARATRRVLETSRVRRRCGRRR